MMIFFLKKYPHTESNRNQRNRNPPFYPLNYEGEKLWRFCGDMLWLF